MSLNNSTLKISKKFIEKFIEIKFETIPYNKERQEKKFKKLFQ
jgi:hypothetical protein